MFLEVKQANTNIRCNTTSLLTIYITSLSILRYDYIINGCLGISVIYYLQSRLHVYLYHTNNVMLFFIPVIKHYLSKPYL